MHIFALIIGVILWIPILCFLMPPYLLCFLVSKIVHIIAKWLRPDLIPLSKIDSLYILGPSNTDSSYEYTCQVWKIKGKIGVEQFRQHFHECFLSTEEDRRKYVNLYCYFVTYFGFPFKKRMDSVDLNFHINELILEEGTTVEEFLGKWMMTHVVDEKTGIQRPIWEVKIIPQGANTTVLFKLHHGNCDGYTMVHLVGKLSGTHAPYLFKEKEPTWPEFLLFFVQIPYFVVELSIKVALSASKAMTNTCTNWNSSKGENWLISFCTLDLETVKEIRRSTNTKLVSVLMSLHIGAMRRLMHEFSENAKELRETYIMHPMGWPEHPAMTKGGGMTNHLTLTTVKTSFNIEDPLDRLLNIQKNLDSSIAKGCPKFFFYIFYNVMKHIPSWIPRLIYKMDWSVFAFETLLSPLMCSPKSHFLLGHPVESLYLPLVTASSARRTKAYIVPVSHSGILDISVNASTALVKNQQMLDRMTGVYFQEELKALIKCCQIETSEDIHLMSEIHAKKASSQLIYRVR